MTDPELRPLPAAKHPLPACGACGEETYPEGADYCCDECGLRFDGETLAATYIDPDAQPCGEPCNNWWHSPDNGTPCRYTCYPCALPEDHVSPHWAGCTYVWSPR